MPDRLPPLVIRNQQLSDRETTLCDKRFRAMLTSRMRNFYHVSYPAILQVGLDETPGIVARLTVSYESSLLTLAVTPGESVRVFLETAARYLISFEWYRDQLTPVGRLRVSVTDFFQQTVESEEKLGADLSGVTDFVVDTRDSTRSPELVLPTIDRAET
jgi:hypothetical protein